MKEERLIFCRNGSEMSVTGGPSSPATLKRVGQRVANHYLKFFKVSMPATLRGAEPLACGEY